MIWDVVEAGDQQKGRKKIHELENDRECSYSSRTYVVIWFVFKFLFVYDCAIYILDCIT